MPRKKTVEEAVRAPEPEVEVSLGPVKSKMQRGTACCMAGVLSLAFVIVLYMLAFGRFPFYGGFASATEVQKTFDGRLTMIDMLGKSLRDLDKKVDHAADRLESRSIAGQINNTQRAYCAALKVGDQSSIGLAGDQLTALLIDYQRLTGDDFPIRPCP